MREALPYLSLQPKSPNKSHSHKVPFCFRKLLSTRRQHQINNSLPQLLVPHQRSLLLISQKRKNEVDKMKLSRRYSEKKVQIIFRKDDQSEKKYQALKSDDRQKIKRIRQLQKMILKTQSSLQKSTTIQKRLSLRYLNSPQKEIIYVNSTKKENGKDLQPIIIRSHAIKTKQLIKRRSRLLKQILKNKMNRD